MKNAIRLLFLLSATVAGSAAFAACGDSACGWVGDSFVCVVEGPNQELRICTENDPCSISC